MSAILRQLDIPTTIYAATGFDNFRKPRTGMWDEILEDHDLTPETVDMTESFFVGDAAGRVAGKGIPNDFADTDRYASPPTDLSFPYKVRKVLILTLPTSGFGDNIGLLFLTPEEYFLDEEPREYVWAFQPKEYTDVAAAADDAGSWPTAGDERDMF